MPKFGWFRFGIEKFGDYVQLGYRAGKLLFGAGGYTSRSLTVDGVVIRGKDMLPNKSLTQAIESKISSYELKFFIQDANNNWVDFSDRTNIGGRNQLLKVGALTYTGERLHGEVRQKVSSITLDNSDGFWSKPFPPSLYASFDEDWNWLGDQVTRAEFEYSQNRLMNSLYRKRIALKANFTTTKDLVPQTITLGVMLIDSCTNHQDSHSTELTVTSLDYPLTEEEAKKVKDGMDWHINRPVTFLVKELIKQVYRDSDGGVPDEYDIDTIVDYPVPKTDTTGWGISYSGRPPTQYYSRALAGGYDAASIWDGESVKMCRVICVHELTVGTLSVVSGSATVTASASVASLGIFEGDVLSIPRQMYSGDGGSETNFGHYGVVSYSDDEIVLDKPINGFESESGLRWAITRVYVGVGNELFRYNQATGEYYRLTSATEALPSGYNIRRLWVNPNDSTWPIWGVALTNPGKGTVGVTMQIFKFRYDGDQPVFSLFDDPITDVLFGEFFTSKQRAATGGAFQGLFDDSDKVRPAWPIVFDQCVVNENFTTAPGAIHRIQGVFKNETDDGETAYGDDIKHAWLSDPETYGWDAFTTSSLVTRGFVSTSWLSADYVTAYGLGPSRFTHGQEGFLLFHPDWMTYGTLIYAKYAFDGGTEQKDIVCDADSGHYDFKYYVVELNGDIATEYQLSMGTTWDALSEVEKGFPVCGAIDTTYNSIWIGTLHSGNSNKMSHKIWKKVWGSDVVHHFGQVDESPEIVPSTLYATYYSLPTEIKVISGRPFVIYCNVYDMAETGVKYIVTSLPFSATPESTSIPESLIAEISSSCLYGLSVISMYNEDTSAYEDMLTYFSAESGMMQRLKVTIGAAPTYTITTERDTVEQFGFLRQEPYSISNVAVAEKSMQLFWISSPVQNYTIPEFAEGRFALMQWSYTVPAVVELADFGEMSVWEAIGCLAEKVDAIYGFYPDGNFFFKTKPRHSLSEYTFGNIENDRVASIDVDMGFSEIINASSRSSSVAVFPPVEITFEISPDSKYGEDGFRHEIEVVRGLMSSRKIKLTCSRGGRTATSAYKDGDETVYVKKRSVFTFETTDGSIESTVMYPVTTSSSSITLDMDATVTYGAAIRLEGENQDDIAEERETIDTVWGEGRVGYILRFSSLGLELDCKLASDIDDSTNEIPLVHTDNTEVDLSGEMTNGAVLSEGMELCIGNFTEGINYEYCRIVEVKAHSLLVQRTTMHERGARSTHIAGETVALLRHGNVYYLRQGEAGLSENYPSEYTGTLFVVGDKATIDFPKGNKADPNDDNSAETDVGTDFVPVNGQFMQIGGDGPLGTGVYANFKFNSDESYEPKFKQGDVVRINAPGLSLVSDKTTSHSYTDMASIKKYSKRDSSVKMDNPFFSEDDARWAVRRDVEEEKYPKRNYEIQCNMVPWILPGSVVTVQDTEMLPRDSEHKEVGYVTEMSFNPQYTGMMTVKIRAMNPY